MKDIFQIKGIRTSLCNRAYYELYPPATETAGCIDILRQLGAIIVGTTKLASFAATEEPIECVDFQAPWTPCADGSSHLQEAVAGVESPLLLMRG